MSSRPKMVKISRIDRQERRLVAAANTLGVIVESSPWYGPKGRAAPWKFALRGSYNDRTILISFNPAKRPTSGSTPAKNKAFADKKAWALKEDFLFYEAKWTLSQEETRIQMMYWLWNAIPGSFA